MNHPKIPNRKAVLQTFKTILFKGLWLFPVLFFLTAIANAQPQKGGVPEALISIPGHMLMNPQWSPDGKTIAFTADNNNGIWLADADGSKVRLLTADEGVGFGFSWSPDGRYIAGRVSITENRRRLHMVKIYNANDASYEILVDKTRGIQGLPMWTMDGSQVVYGRNNNVQFTNSARLPSPNPDKLRSMVFASMDKILLVDPLSKSSDLIQSFDGRLLFNVSPSPEGNKVSFQVQGLGLHVMDADGSNLKQIGKGEKAAWLPGEKFVVVSVSEDDGYTITGGELFLVNIATGEHVHLTPHTSLIAQKPNVSPSGEWVLFEYPNDGHIYRMELK